MLWGCDRGREGLCVVECLCVFRLSECPESFFPRPYLLLLYMPMKQYVLLTFSLARCALPYALALVALSSPWEKKTENTHPFAPRTLRFASPGRLFWIFLSVRPLRTCALLLFLPFLLLREHGGQGCRQPKPWWVEAPNAPAQEDPTIVGGNPNPIQSSTHEAGKPRRLPKRSTKRQTRGIHLGGPLYPHTPHTALPTLTRIPAPPSTHRHTPLCLGAARPPTMAPSTTNIRSSRRAYCLLGAATVTLAGLVGRYVHVGLDKREQRTLRPLVRPPTYPSLFSSPPHTIGRTPSCSPLPPAPPPSSSTPGPRPSPPPPPRHPRVTATAGAGGMAA